MYITCSVTNNGNLLITCTFSVTGIFEVDKLLVSSSKRPLRVMVSNKSIK